MSRRLNFFVTAVLLCGLCVNSINAAETSAAVSKCEAFTDVKSKSRESFSGTALMQIAGILENQGEVNFDIAYAPPARQCVVELFDIADTKVSVIFSPWEKGEATLLFKAIAETQSEHREILVVYDGLVSVVNKETVFHVSEKRNGVVSWYAMYKDQPTYAAIKVLLTNILDGKALPLMSVRWPEHAKEGEVLVFDNKRLK